MKWTRAGSSYKKVLGDIELTLGAGGTWLEVRHEDLVIHGAWHAACEPKTAKRWATNEAKWFLIDLKRQVDRALDSI